jgi:hypothetical protein
MRNDSNADQSKGTTLLQNRKISGKAVLRID